MTNLDLSFTLLVSDALELKIFVIPRPQNKIIKYAGFVDYNDIYFRQFLNSILFNILTESEY